MRIIGRMHIVDPDDVSALMEALTEEPTPPETLERRRKALAEAEKIRQEIAPLKEDLKDLIRRERGEELVG